MNGGRIEPGGFGREEPIWCFCGICRETRDQRRLIAAGAAPPAVLTERGLATQADFQPWLPITMPSTTSVMPVTLSGVIGSLKNSALASITSTNARLMNG